MATLTTDCPHCRTGYLGLRIVHTYPMRASINHAVHLVCPKCSMPSCAEVSENRSNLAPAHWGSNDIGAFNWRLVRLWPEPPAPNIPEQLPPDVERIYLQAERNFPIEGNEEAAGTMYRKALDVGLKSVDPETKGTLAVRIKKLATANKLTPAIAEWADHVRDLGNEAAHEDAPPTREELTDLRNISEMVMRYLFSLPALVEARKPKAE